MFSSLDLRSTDCAEIYTAMFFSNEMARLFKLPTTVPVRTLCQELIASYELLDTYGNRQSILANIPDTALDVFDNALCACKAIRSLCDPRPWPEGNKAASAMFAPKDGAESLSKGVLDLANSVRSSRTWMTLLDSYWGESVNDDRLAATFQEICKSLDKALTRDDLASVDIHAAVRAVDAAVKLEDCILNEICLMPKGLAFLGVIRSPSSCGSAQTIATLARGHRDDRTARIGQLPTFAIHFRRPQVSRLISGKFVSFEASLRSGCARDMKSAIVTFLLDDMPSYLADSVDPTDDAEVKATSNELEAYVKLLRWVIGAESVEKAQLSKLKGFLRDTEERHRGLVRMSQVQGLVAKAREFGAEDGQSAVLLEALESTDSTDDVVSPEVVEILRSARMVILEKFATRARTKVFPIASSDDNSLLKGLGGRANFDKEQQSQIAATHSLLSLGTSIVDNLAKVESCAQEADHDNKYDVFMDTNRCMKDWSVAPLVTSLPDTHVDHKFLTSFVEIVTEKIKNQQDNLSTLKNAIGFYLSGDSLNVNCTKCQHPGVL